MAYGIVTREPANDSHRATWRATICSARQSYSWS